MNKQFETRDEIELWLVKMRIEKYTINDDLTVDVPTYVDLSNRNLSFIPVQFGKVALHFFCYSNKLTDLKGSPRFVGGTFACEDNQLTSLVGAPKEVGGDFDCHENQITDFSAMPKIIGGEIDCSKNPAKEQAVVTKHNSALKIVEHVEATTEVNDIIQNTEIKKPRLKA